ncbi:MAG: hypothetical protein IJ736_08395 [Firmicutes bacterium]|nr:hypothetical protein [Bacillota bacterium]
MKRKQQTAKGIKLKLSADCGFDSEICFVKAVAISVSCCGERSVVFGGKAMMII